jgi:Zn-dependent protease with chaperone function
MCCATAGVRGDRQLCASVAAVGGGAPRGVSLDVIALRSAHANSTDARLTAALNRLAILAPRQVPVTINPLRWIWRIAFYGLALQALAPVWAAWFRHREYHADRYAHTLGQGPPLANCLENDALPYDCPIPYMAISGHTHPYTEHRIDRLHQLADS